MAVLKRIAALLCLLAAGGTAAAEITVAPGESIAAAIARAAAGDVIRIERGRYEERLLIDKPLTLKGIGRPTVSGGLEGDTIRIVAEDVVIDGLIVSNSGDSLREQNAGIYIQPGAHRAVVRNCDLSYNLFGLWIEKADDVRVENNLITGLSRSGPCAGCRGVAERRSAAQGHHHPARHGAGRDHAVADRR